MRSGVSCRGEFASFGWSLEQVTGQDVPLTQKIGRAAEYLEVCALLVRSARAAQLVKAWVRGGSTKSVFRSGLTVLQPGCLGLVGASTGL